MAARTHTRASLHVYRHCHIHLFVYALVMQGVIAGIIALFVIGLLGLSAIAELGPYVVDLARWLLNLTGLTDY